MRLAAGIRCEEQDLSTKLSMKTGSEARPASRNRGVVRRLLALWLALLPLQGYASVVFAAESGTHGQCTDHVCACMRHCPPKKAGGHGCHEAAPASAFSLEPGRCDHPTDGTVAPSVEPHVVPVAALLGRAFDRAPTVIAAAPRPHTGFLHIDLQPPRARA